MRVAWRMIYIGGSMHLKNKKLILKIKELCLKLYNKNVEVLIDKTYYTKKKPIKITAYIVGEDLLPQSGSTTQKALKKLKKLLKKKIAEQKAFQQSAAEVEQKRKETERVKEALKKDVEFWKLANAAEQNNITVKETINNPALSSMTKEPEQLSLPFMEENKNEQLGQ